MRDPGNEVGYYPPWPSASVDNTLLVLQNSSCPTQPHSIIANCLASVGYNSLHVCQRKTQHLSLISLISCFLLVMQEVVFKVPEAQCICAIVGGGGRRTLPKGTY